MQPATVEEKTPRHTGMQTTKIPTREIKRIPEQNNEDEETSESDDSIIHF